MDWIKAENNELWGFIEKLVKIRTTKTFTKYDHCFINSTSRDWSISIIRESSSGAKYKTEIHVDENNGMMPYSETCVGNVIATPNCCNGSLTAAKCPLNSNFTLNYLDGIFLNITQINLTQSEFSTFEPSTTEPITVTF